MKITLKQIKKLRTETRAGVMDVKKALEESAGDFEKAKKWLAKKGLDKAVKKANRETCEGTIGVYVHNGEKIGALVKLTCETDFVAKTEEFKTLACELAMQVASMNPKSVDELLAQDYIRDSSKKISDLVNQAIAKLGENIRVEEIVRLSV